MSIIFIQNAMKNNTGSLDYTDYETITQIRSALKRGKIWVIFFRNLCNQGPPDLSLGIIVESFSSFPSQVTSPDHFTQQGTGPIFGVPQFFVKIVLNHQEGI